MAAQRDNLGKTPMHHAAATGNTAAARLLLAALPAAAAGAERAPDVSGMAAADYACRWGAADADAAAALLGGKPCARPLASQPSEGAGSGGDSGGWEVADDPAGDASASAPMRCDIEAVPASTSAEEFRARFVARALPAIVRGAALSVPQRATWTRAKLLASNATARARVRALDIPFECRFGADLCTGARRREVALRDFIAQISAPGNRSLGYVFHAPLERDARALFPRGMGALPRFLQLDLAEDAVPELRARAVAADGGSGAAPLRRRHRALLSATDGERRAAGPGDPAQFYLGAAGSGSPWHAHEAAANSLVFGRKRWFLRAPAFALASTARARSLAADAGDGGDGRTLECTQEAGDVLFVPEGWAHAVVNLRASVGFAVEFIEVVDTEAGAGDAADADEE